MNARKLLVISLVLMTVFSFGVTPRQATAAACPVVNYRFTTFDNGMGGIWATDYFVSLVTICQVGPSLYQVTYADGGSFETLNANSPGGGGTVVAGVTGSLSGGEVLLIQGVLRNPLPTNVTMDWRGYPRPVPYEQPFFSTVTSKAYVSWGWKYTVCDGRRWTDNEATESEYAAHGPNAMMGDISGGLPVCASPAQFFDPGDGRVDPRPGDHLAVYCVLPDTIQVYGINETNSRGFWLASFSNKELLKAGMQGVYKVVVNNGQVSISTDGNGNYWLAWNGGEHHADGQPNHGFAKGFHCSFAQ